MDFCLLRGPSTAVEPGTLGLQLGPLILIVVITMRAHTAAEVLEVPESLEVLV